MSIEENIRTINGSIKEAVKLLAVSKTKPMEDIEVAYKCGIRDFGENKVQELVQKYDELPKDIRWHMIGNLQKNKVKYLVGKVYLIHSISSLDLLNKINQEFKKHNKIAEGLVQINIGKEESKGGIFEEDVFSFMEEADKLSNVKIKGIMVIIPKGTMEQNRMFFKKTKLIFDNLKKKNYQNISMEILSMGMSHDYVEAIEEGSTLIRIGEGIFGKREYKKEEN